MSLFSPITFPQFVQVPKLPSLMRLKASSICIRRLRSVSESEPRAISGSEAGGQGRPIGWAASTVREILFRELYRGIIVWNKTRKRDVFGHIELIHRWWSPLGREENNRVTRTKNVSEILPTHAPRQATSKRQA